MSGSSVGMAISVNTSDQWNRAEGQQRDRPLSATLAAAKVAAGIAGVTRLADVSGLTPFGVPIFQAIRPLALSISVSQGKGLTPMAAQVSALLESVELDVAEQIARPPDCKPLQELGREAMDLWCNAPRDRFAVRLDPTIPRPWLSGRCLHSGRILPVPFDLVSLDFTTSPALDAHASSSGLASGNTPIEAMAGALAELLERDLTSTFDDMSPIQRRAREVDLDSIDDALIQRLLRRVTVAGYDVRLWSIGQDLPIAAMRCAIVARADNPALPPTIGSGCHSHRQLATLRAVLEAVQVHATLVAGARDDLRQEHYDDAGARKWELILDTLSFDRGTLDWLSVPNAATPHQEQTFEVLLNAARQRTALPVIGIEHDCITTGISVVRAIAPGLADPARIQALPLITIVRPRPRKPSRPPVVFIGPTLGDEKVPFGIERLAPAVCGDLAALLHNPPIAVGLVDGCFATKPSVWHKEILDLIGHGIPVFGAASLGALRAAELHEFGMIGVGRIFAAYRDLEIVRDDAVMLIHAPAELGWRPLTISLVDAEAILHSVPMEEGIRRMFLRIVRTLPYSERTWEACLAEFAKRTGLPPPIDSAALYAQPSFKLEDAKELFALLISGGLPNIQDAFAWRPTAGYLHLLADITAKRQ